VLHSDTTQNKYLKYPHSLSPGIGIAETYLLQTSVERPNKRSVEIGSAEELGHEKAGLAEDAPLDFGRPDVSQGEIQDDAGDAFDIPGEGAIENCATLNQHVRDVCHAAGIDHGCPAAVPDHAVGRLRSA